MPGDVIRVEDNGQEAGEAALSLLEHDGWGHFTAMQVRGGRTRGLDLHVARLKAAHQEAYGRALDDAQEGRISEGGITNVGFWRDGTAVWPDAPKLDGITMLFLRRELTAAGIPQAEVPVRVQDLHRYDGMIMCNSAGWAPVNRVDDLAIPLSEAFTGVIAAASGNCHWDEI